MKKRFKIGLFVGGLAVAVSWFVASSDSERISSFGFGAQPVTLKQVDSLPLEGLEVAKSVESGESHSIALDLLVSLAKRQQQLADSDTQALLSFISAPKPDGLSEGEREERVHVVLNALRVQEKEVPGLTEFLLTTAEQHPSRILRLYAMQHLALWHHRERSVEMRRENQGCGGGHLEL